MKRTSKEATAIFALLILVVAMMQTAQLATAATESVTKAKLTAFLSEVIGFHMNYRFWGDFYNVSRPSNYGGKVEEVDIIAPCTVPNGQINVLAVFYNDCIYDIYFVVYGSATYVPQASLDWIKNVMKEYRTFAANYNIDIDHVETALSLLDKVSELQTVNATSGDMKMVMTCQSNNVGGIPSNITQVQWIYSTNIGDAAEKCISISLTQGEVKEIRFADTWDLFSVSNKCISQAEAKSIGWNAPLNHEVTLTNADGLTTNVQPNWTKNFTQVSLGYILGQVFNNTLNDTLHFANGGGTHNDPLILYPLWEFDFYFGRSISGNEGIQVGVWGDTKEIDYCSSFGILSSGSPSAGNTPEPSSGNMQPPTQNSEPSQSHAAATPSLTSSPSAPELRYCAVVVLVISLTAVILVGLNRKVNT